ncbi:MAG: ribonuclease III [Opitutaceae bacterium]|nr:ribonuclease III [Opitutaceae bacterium]
MSDILRSLQARLGHTFRNPALLETALTHSSRVNEPGDAADSNQRLEFLGDAVLSLILAETLFQAFPAEREGGLSQRRAMLSRGGFLARLARELNLGAALRLGVSEEQTGGRDRDSNLEDAFEALVGALYLDAGPETTRRVVLALYGPLADRLASTTPADNPKGRLQELVQPKLGNDALRYVTVHSSGQDHAREYAAEVFLQDRLLGAGRGPSKKLAEEAAARAALATFRPEDSA